MAVIISAAVGEKSKTGKPAANKKNDVEKIQNLLRIALGTKNAPRMTIGVYDALTKGAIAEFQRLWANNKLEIDSRIDPRGKTLARLNRIVEPLVLKSVELEHLYWRYPYPTQKGFGYKITYKPGYKDNLSLREGLLPKQFSPYKIFLGIGNNDSNALDITDRNMVGVIDDKNLPQLLKLIEKMGSWGALVNLRLYVKYGNGLVSKSKPVPMKTPVKPYSGKLGAELLKKNNVVDMTYGATDSKGRDGRYLWTTPFNGKYYFAYGSKFETNNALRGLVCITYVGAVYGVGARESVKNTWGFKNEKGSLMKRVNVMSAYGTQLAVHLNAKKTKPEMEAKNGDEIKEFFKKNSRGSYMMWREGHTVLVVDGMVHEFTNRYGKKQGYHQHDAQEYEYGKTIWWVRKLSRPVD